METELVSCLIYCLTYRLNAVHATQYKEHHCHQRCCAACAAASRDVKWEEGTLSRREGSRPHSTNRGWKLSFVRPTPLPYRLPDPDGRGSRGPLGTSRKSGGHLSAFLP